VRRCDTRRKSVDLVGKHGRMRTIPVPTLVKVAIESWPAPGAVAIGC
jgi:hypothetical protein